MAAEALFPGLEQGEAPLRSALPGDGPRTASDRGRRARDGVRGPSPLGGAAHALRLVVGGKVLAFSGDTEWVDALVPAGKDADLFIMECYQFDGAPRFHMSWKIIAEQLDRIGAKRVMLTHMASSMLARQSEVDDPRSCWLKTASCSRYENRRAQARDPAARGAGLPGMRRCPQGCAAAARAASGAQAQHECAACASAARRRARACTPRGRRSPIRPATGCGNGSA